MTRNQTEYPRLLQYAGGTLLLGSTPEGPISLRVSLDDQTLGSQTPREFAVAVRAAETDPRYMYPVAVQGVELCESWSIGRLRPWLQIIADRELPSRLRGRLDPSDVVQQTLLKAWQGESDFCGSTHEERLVRQRDKPADISPQATDRAVRS